MGFGFERRESVHTIPIARPPTLSVDRVLQHLILGFRV